MVSAKKKVMNRDLLALAAMDSDQETDYSGDNQRQRGECTVCLLQIGAVVKMCPHCNALLCQSCIDQLPTDRCPKCRVEQNKDRYVRNRPIEEMIREMKQAKHMTCQVHELDKVLYCMTCREAYCPECFMDNHIGHERKNLQKVYQEKKQSLLAAFEPIEKKIGEINTMDAEMKEELKQIKESETKKDKAISSFVKLLKETVQ